MRPEIKITNKIRMRVGDFEVVDGVWRVISVNRQHRDLAQIRFSDPISEKQVSLLKI